jgi:DNA uptake protein ComE-like DNA-binding protein
MAFLDWFSAITQSPQLTLAGRALKARIANDPFYRFQSLEEIRLAVALGIKIDVNQATVDDWLRLPGFSIHQSRLLTQLSQAGVQFYCVEDIAAALGISTQRIKALEPVMQFCFYDAEGMDAIDRINPNTASIEVLAQLPGIDPGLAKSIVHHRTIAGAYRNLADMQQRLYLPSQVTATLMHYLRF